jgi:signal transduction histidine kinase
VHSLLDDVKALVSAYKDDVPVDLSRELRELARDLPTPRIHLECPIDVQLTDPRVGRALLRCAQEFVTNSIRHGAARNVWIGVAIDVNRARLVARDDGIGATDIRDGFGLSGMRRRMQELGGTLEIKGHLQSFEVSAELPVQLPEHGPAT